MFERVLIEKIKRKNPNRTKIIKPKSQESKAPEPPLQKIQRQTSEVISSGLFHAEICMAT